MIQRLLATLSISLLIALFASGCGHHTTVATNDNIFRVPMNDTPSTFDPAMVEDGMTIGMLQQVFEGLVQWTPDNKLSPALAESWTVGPDGLTYTFKIRKNVFFQDGAPVTAQDVYYSMRRSLDPRLKSPVALTYLGDIVGSDAVFNGKANDLSGVKVIDPYTVAITIKRPKAYWIYTLTYPTAYVVSKEESDAANGPMTDASVEKGAGTGPFRLTQYEPDQSISLASNAHYWGGAPPTAGQEILIVKDAGTRHALYLSGKLDLVDEDQGDLLADSLDPSLKDQVHYFRRAATWYVALNEKNIPPFADIRVRQALAYATDKALIAHDVFGGHVDAANDLLPEGIPGYDPKFKDIPYDPAKGRALLAAAGYPGGKGFPEIPLAYRQSDPAIEKTADFLRQMWSDNLGIPVKGVRTQWSVLMSEEDKGALDAWYIRWSADYLDQQDYYSVLLRTGSSEDHYAYSNPPYDALCDAADVCPDPAKRSALYRKAARIAADQVPVIPLYYETDVELVKPYVKNLDDSLMGHLPYEHVTLER